ncbi:MAG TPA: CGNR zinc finger domain-containing protein [Galbitalea sp.]|nr:CGNR zinc finger domain-containing protein [Galbitalea sp.]
MPQSVATGQWIRRDGQNWWFDAGSVAIDFAYAGGFGDAPESLRDVDALGAWLSARYSGLEGEPTDRELADAHALQQALARLVSAAGAREGGAAEDIDIVNLFAATPDIPPSLAGGTRQAGRSRARVGQALSAITREAIDIFSGDNRDRVRACAAEDCDLIFYDESRSNNRRWCSMKRCGNRAKVRAHRTRALEL